MPEPKSPIYIVDDDEAIRRSLSFMLKTSGYDVRTFEDGQSFLSEVESLPAGCVLLDVRMPDMGGLEVQEALRAIGSTHPVIVMTGHGDVDTAVAAMKGGAIDFIEKPFEKQSLLSTIDAARERSGADKSVDGRKGEAETQLKVLSEREREVLQGLVKGFPNKTIAYDLGISPRTVEIHRANLMQKLSVRSLSEALRIAFRAGWE